VWQRLLARERGDEAGFEASAGTRLTVHQENQAVRQENLAVRQENQAVLQEHWAAHQEHRGRVRNTGWCVRKRKRVKKVTGTRSHPTEKVSRG